jgi:hypothetical protein
MFAVTDAIASFSWNMEQIPGLLLELSDSMSDEVRWLADLDSVGVAA